MHIQTNSVSVKVIDALMPVFAFSLDLISSVHVYLYFFLWFNAFSNPQLGHLSCLHREYFDFVSILLCARRLEIEWSRVKLCVFP